MESWNKFENGTSIGTRGSEDGKIIADVEHPSGARLTLEEKGTVAPFSITSGVYGGFFHTSFFSDKETAEKSFKSMQAELSEFFSLELDSEQTYEWVTNFVNKY